VHEHEHEHWDDEFYDDYWDDELAADEYDRLEKIGAPSQFGDEWQALLLSMEMHSASLFRTETDIFILVLMPILERQDWLNWYLSELLIEMKADEMQERIAARADTLDTVLNAAAIRRYKPERAARLLLQPWL
jgi:hypothetical protein